MLNSEIPEALIALIKDREGFLPKSYDDSLGNLTGGWGHLLIGHERTEYPDGTPIPAAVTEAWFDTDISRAWDSGQAQAEQLGEPRLASALAAVTFQMGPAWMLPETKGGKGFVQTWKLLAIHEWNAAAKEAGSSAWARETPLRYQDFARALSAISDTSIVPPAQSKLLP